jgi:hypothetical protein
MRRVNQLNFFAHLSLRDRLNQPGLSGSLRFLVLLQNAGGAQISLLMDCLWKEWVSTRPENPTLHCCNARCGAGLHGKRTESSVLIYCQVVFKIPHLLLVSRNLISASKKMAAAATKERTKTLRSRTSPAGLAPWARAVDERAKEGTSQVQRT